MTLAAWASAAIAAPDAGAAPDPEPAGAAAPLPSDPELTEEDARSDATSSAPDDGPAAAPEPASSPGRPVVRFEELTADLGFDLRWQGRQTITDTRGQLFFQNRDRQTNRARSFEETIGLHGSGDIVNERVLRYQFNLRGGFSQDSYFERRPGPDLNDSPHGDLLQYDARATLFPAGKISANFFALKEDDRLPRMFLPSLDRQNERYGAEVIYSDRKLPMRLTLDSAYEELRGYDRDPNDDERHNDRRLEYEATWQPSEFHQLRLDYEYDDRREEYSGSNTEFDTVRNYLTLNHTLQFGENHRNRLDTVARIQDETGDLARDVYEFAPQLTLQHTDTLSSNYRLQYFKESFEGSERDLYRGDFGLNHRVGDWLNTALALYGIKENTNPGGDTNEWGGIATAAVSRDNALGRLTANLTYNHAWQHTESDDRDGVVVSEAVTLRDPLPGYLAHTDVRRYSIVVTDAERSRTFLLGRDYFIYRIGRYTALFRAMTGHITDGQTVLVSYRYRTEQAFTLNRDRLDVRVQEAFTSGWTPYYAASLQEEYIDSTPYLTYVPRDICRQRLGVDYRRKTWSAGTEAEYNDDAIDPYKAMHFRGDATFYDQAPHSLSGRGNFSFLRFDGSGDLGPHETSMLDLGLAYRFLLDPQWDMGATAAYRFEDDSVFGVTHGVDLNAGLNWTIGLFTASLDLEYDLLDLPNSSDGTFAVWIKLRREFPLLGSRNQ